MVDSLSKGQIGYVHIASMNSNSFRKAYSEILGRYRNRKAIIIDTRYNGGRMAARRPDPLAQRKTICNFQFPADNLSASIRLPNGPNRRQY